MAEPFTAFTGTDGMDTTLFGSMMSSLMEGPSASSRSISSPTAASASPTDAASTVSETRSPSQRPPSTFTTLPSSSRSSIASGTSSSVATNVSSALSSSAAAASTSNTAASTDGGSTGDKCSGVSCSPGLQAAIAVPVVVGVLAIVALLFCLAKRRRRRRENAPQTSVSGEKPKKKWTRHLRIFSFDNELLTGGRSSSNNSTRSGQSNQHLARSQNTEKPIIHSIDDTAPPYRDTVGHKPQPNVVQTGAGVAAGGLTAGALAATTIPRSTSGASAPPPYGQTAENPQTNPTNLPEATPDPFVDTVAAGATTTGSPFVDPSEDGHSFSTRPAISRNSSIHTGASSLEESEAGSIREAQVGRHLSIISGGRTITNVRNSSHSPPQSQTPPNGD